MRRLASIVVLGLACGCGGGGGGDPAPAGVGELPQDPRTLQEALTDCVTQNVRDGIAFVRTMGEMAEGGTVPGLALDGVDLVTLTFSWSLDGDLDGTPEAEGTARFVDAAGRPWLPVDLLAALAGTATPEDVFADVPDGTRAILTFDLLRFVDGDGRLDVAFAAGLPNTADGGMTLSDGPCTTTISFDDLRLPTTADGYPTGVVVLDARSGPDDVDGTLTLDGTSLARASATVNGGAPEEATIDLSTGEVR